MTDADETLAVRAAWLHYAGGLTQSDVARRLGIPSVKAHRLIARAVADGVVKVTIDGDIVECVELETRLAERFGLQYCEVAPDLGEEGLPLRALGHAGAGYLKREIEHGDHAVIGLGHGRTLSAAVQYMPRMSAKQTQFVSLLGGLTRNYGANPYDVMHRIAEKTGTQAYVMPVPFFANTADDLQVLRAQRGVKEVFDLANAADLKLVGLGTVDAEAQLVLSGMVEPAEIEDIASAGGVGEILGHFFDANGQVLDTALTARTLSASFPQTAKERLVALAGGLGKVPAIRAILRSRRLHGLITDERTAQALLS
ncbi:sugar-binding transcriptional regulator [Rhizobium bangladeshense]|uniref:sugar-binding transcriptional regulator n=1 Tax=Rhizobium bangladeshense TaxID=1138189 RepID=UPI001A9911BB|nr:sugar-binding transcriptional regulator [Rhizobium bangladeshense]MBX4891131.1 sugar-binding transcriptional regulator [Rhizobium bangladeshense]MBX4897089.1 sugar-binding transcriptional regulator [Rhizobium bangladeshense]MBX4900872.1 sugar-binding transcriptional regulator [Rhizobium bangladeshense]MBX4915580.1 sugar-binding transcriptional regulator [Rhizobium bangladeshense]MBX4934705.1 sugar-binding transcriptional regulator [Rhizobium bangladeshense]